MGLCENACLPAAVTISKHFLGSVSLPWHVIYYLVLGQTVSQRSPAFILILVCIDPAKILFLPTYDPQSLLTGPA